MKKILSASFLVFGLMLSLVSCKKDDMEGPDAQVFGTIKDKVTGQPVETDLINGASIEAFELGYATPVSQRWVIKNTGEYRNNLVFSNKYNFELRNSNFYPVSLAEYQINPGQNQLDFQVVPYLRIKNARVVHDKAANKVVATFNLEAGDPQVKVKAARLYAYSDIYVGEPIKFNTTGTGFSRSFSPSALVDGAEMTLSIDLSANSSLFPAGRDYFFRIGALADVTGVGTVRHNYAPLVKISL